LNFAHSFYEQIGKKIKYEFNNLLYLSYEKKNNAFILNYYGTEHLKIAYKELSDLIIDIEESK